MAVDADDDCTMMVNIAPTAIKMSTEKVLKTIDQLFSDTTVSQEETKNRLQEIIDHCEILQESLDS